ncbi:MAG: hypothetical protein F4065_01175 [Rhodothermaceae bacterium]|nr:hypothetical protein [Rhodothermaceae bacterium]MXZ57052.1 hypothetical protein [Rhodothermaceae bacterium]MYB90786.1 hypothetical protein [Rhodothermaceae bacterium]MYD68657.1 hypothetical protein [Rhodothermaceae bacterium]MYG45246.1 hypothetical protein [Rhodothermaceae bacterium]
MEEAAHLIPIIAEINLTDLELSAPIRQLQLFEPLPPKKKTQKSVTFARAPISITRILRVYVKSDKTREEVLSQVQLRNNVPLKPGIIKRRKTSFTTALKKWTWKQNNQTEEVDPPILLAQASGGILAMLNHVKDRSMAAKKAFSSAFEIESTDPPIPGLSEWIEKGHIVPWTESEEGYLLWSLVEKLATHRDNSNDNDLDELVLHFLENLPAKIHHRTLPLCKTLLELGGLGGSTIPEYFNLHTDPLGRAVILFFLRRQCRELLEFDQAIMTDHDWAYSAILFGARSGWLRLSLELRSDENLGDKICDWMTSYCHRIENIKTPMSH